MFGTIRQLSGALQGLADALGEGRSSPVSGPKVEALELRIARLEQTLAITVAESEATLLKAVAERKVARNAEERARKTVGKGHSGAGEDDPTEFDFEGKEDLPPEYLKILQDHYAGGGGGVPVVPEAVEVDGRVSTRRAKANWRLNGHQ